jgi:hypothetical protein
MVSELKKVIFQNTIFMVYMPPPEPHLHGVRTAPCRTLNRILPEPNLT